MKTGFRLRPDWLPLGLLVVGIAANFSGLLRVPSGINGDAARLGLHTLDFLERGIWPFYIYHQFAPDPLIIYLQAMGLTLFGYTRETLQGVTALAGALAVPGIYFACRELFAGQGARFSRRVGVLAGLGLALSPYFIAFVHQGIEGASLPILELLTVGWLWRGIRRQSWLDYCCAGVCLGLTQYAYIVARAFPPALGCACLLALWADHSLRQYYKGLALTALSAIIVVLPQWLLFLQAPYTFVARTERSAGQFIFGLPDAGAIFTTKLVNQVLMLGWHWDDAYNPFLGRPLLNPVLFLGFVAAIVIALHMRKAAYLFALALAASMLVPDLLTYEGTNPSATRLIGAVPFLFLLAGLGLANLWQWLRAQPRVPAWIGAGIGCLVVLAGLESQWDFLTRVQPQVQHAVGLEWQTSLVEIAEARYINAHPDVPILVPSSEYQRAPLAFLLAQHFRQRASGLGNPLPAGTPVTVVVPAEPERPTSEGIPAGYLPDEWVLLQNNTAYFLPPLVDSVQLLGQPQSLFADNGVLAATARSANWLGVHPQMQATQGEFENGLNLVGYHADTLIPGQPITVTFYWQPQHPIKDDVRFLVQILDRENKVIAGLTDWPLHGAYRVVAWQSGEIMPVSYRLSIPADLPPGPYRLTTAVLDLIHQNRVPLRDGGDFVTAATLKVPLPANDEMPAQTLNSSFGDAIHLTGYTAAPTVGNLRLTLFWQASKPPTAAYTVFIHLVNAAGKVVSQSDAQPLMGQYPTSIWNLGETVVESRTLAVPTGSYRVYVGLYDAQTQVRLPSFVNGVRSEGDQLLLEAIYVP